MMKILKLLLIILILVSCSSNSDEIKDSLNILQYKSVKLNNYEISNKETAALNKYLQNLSTASYSIYDKSDITLYCYDDKNELRGTFSVFFKQKIIYKGFYLDAWTERMENKKSVCIKINDSAVSYLENLIKDHNIE